VKTEIIEQIQACPNCEQINTITSKLIDGKWQQVDFNPGEE
jgi:phage FluMu protein Com